MPGDTIDCTVRCVDFGGTQMNGSIHNRGTATWAFVEAQAPSGVSFKGYSAEWITEGEVSAASTRSLIMSVFSFSRL